MLKSYRWWGGGVVVAHKILLSAPVPIGPLFFFWVSLVSEMGLGLWGLGLGLGLDSYFF